MKGFKNPNHAYKAKKTTGKHMMVENHREENESMINAGFTIDRENAIYVREGFGAFKSNVDKKIKTIDDLRSYTDKLVGKNPYSEIVRLIDEEGYEFVLGPGAPDSSGNDLGLTGLYCKNYKEIIEKQSGNNKSITPKDALKNALCDTTIGQISEAITAEHANEQGEQTHDKQ